MKRTILTLVLALMIGLVFGQTETQKVGDGITEPAQLLDVNTVTVKDTTFAQDSRLNYMVTTILPAVQKFMSEELARQKVAGNLTHEQATIKLYNDLQAATYTFAQNFVVVNEVAVNPEQIVQEFSELNARIEALNNDEDIKYIEAVREFQTIKERQEQLAKYYYQIEKAKEDAKPKYPEWQQPVGAHDSYNKPDRVLWNGKVWETTINANVWSPAVTGWREVIE